MAELYDNLCFVLFSILRFFLNVLFLKALFFEFAVCAETSERSLYFNFFILHPEHLGSSADLGISMSWHMQNPLSHNKLTPQTILSLIIESFRVPNLQESAKIRIYAIDLSNVFLGSYFFCLTYTSLLSFLRITMLIKCTKMIWIVLFSR